MYPIWNYLYSWNYLSDLHSLKVINVLKNLHFEIYIFKTWHEIYQISSMKCTGFHEIWNLLDFMHEICQISPWNPADFILKSGRFHEIRWISCTTTKCQMSQGPMVLFLAHLEYMPMSLYNHDSWFHHNMGSCFWFWWCMCCLCMLLLARILIIEILYFVDILHNILNWCTWNI